MRYHLLLILVLLALAMGCSSGWQLAESTDEATGARVFETRRNMLHTTGSTLVLDVRKLVKQDKEVEYQFVALAGDSTTMLHIPDKQPSLFLDVDGKQYSFATPARSGWTMGYNVERVTYPKVPEGLVRALARAVRPGEGGR